VSIGWRLGQVRLLAHLPEPPADRHEQAAITSE